MRLLHLYLGFFLGSKYLIKFDVLGYFMSLKKNLDLSGFRSDAVRPCLLMMYLSVQVSLFLVKQRNKNKFFIYLSEDVVYLSFTLLKNIAEN